MNFLRVGAYAPDCQWLLPMGYAPLAVGFVLSSVCKIRGRREGVGNQGRAHGGRHGFAKHFCTNSQKRSAFLGVEAAVSARNSVILPVKSYLTNRR